MATYRAATAIRYSGAEKDEDGAVVVTRFEAGEVVTGLPNETMKELWVAGALEKVATMGEPEETSTTEDVVTEATPAADETAADAAPAAEEASSGE